MEVKGHGEGRGKARVTIEAEGDRIDHWPSPRRRKSTT